MFAILKKEFKFYFYSPIAYILIGLFVALVSIFFFGSNINSQSADLSQVLSTIGFILSFIIPILTMRILSEDRKTGTEVLYITSPVSLVKMVLGKYLAMVLVFIVMICFTIVYPIIIFVFARLSSSIRQRKRTNITN